ncbi:MAG: hypothetical protein RIQ82_838, partial [Bacteroidota bacterium]
LNTDDSEPDQFRIYPNPSSDQLQIKGAFQNRLDYRISNNLGQVLLEGVVKGEANSIDINSLPAGIYFIALFDRTSQQIQRIIKN